MKVINEFPEITTKDEWDEMTQTIFNCLKKLKEQVEYGIVLTDSVYCVPERRKNNERNICTAIS